MREFQSNKVGLILNLRPSVYQARVHHVFGELPWAIYDCPLTQAEPVGATIPSPDGFDSVIFTSQIAVGLFLADPRWFTKKVYAVGAATAEAARRVGYREVVQTGVNVDDLRGHLAASTFRCAFYPSASDVTSDLPLFFPGRIQRTVIYRMIPRTGLPPQVTVQARAGTPIVAPLFSRRSADTFAYLLRDAGIGADNAHITAVGMSADVFAGGDSPWQRQVVADKPTLDDLAIKTGEAIESLNT